MNIHKKILLIVIAFFCSIPLTHAMERPASLEEQLWDALYKGDQLKIHELIIEGANVNTIKEDPNPDNDRMTTLSYALFQPTLSPVIQRLPIVLELLAAGALGQQQIVARISLVSKGTSKPDAYKDQAAVFKLLKKLQVTPNELQSIIAGSASLQKIAQEIGQHSLPVDIRKKITRDMVQVVLDHKLAGFAQELQFMDAQSAENVRTILKLNIERTLRNQPY